MFRSNRSQSSHERTAEERERARQERERRRAGLDSAASPPPVESRHLEEPAHVEPPTAETPHVEVAPLVAGPEPAPVVEEPAPPPAHDLPLPPEEPALTAPSPPTVASRPDSRLTRRVHGLREHRASSGRWHRRLRARLFALVALAAVGVAIWLLAQSLGGSAHKAVARIPPVIKVTIPEGYTRARIATLAQAEGLRGSYLGASARSALLHPTHYGAPHGTPSLEGFLFPATYELRSGAPAKRLVDEQLRAFREHFAGAEIHRAHVLGVTPYALLTIASMIEREAEVEHDRPLIAAVIYNRLHQGIPLGIDATIRYALNDYSKPLTEAQLQSSSPYNTRLNHGLPPTPIGSPGAASIQAAAHPAHVPYLYYVAAADGCGEHVFSASFAQFEHDAAAYREAVAKNHGRVPTCHKK